MAEEGRGWSGPSIFVLYLPQSYSELPLLSLLIVQGGELMTKMKWAKSTLSVKGASLIRPRGAAPSLTRK